MSALPELLVLNDWPVEDVRITANKLLERFLESNVPSYPLYIEQVDWRAATVDGSLVSCVSRDVGWLCLY